MNKLILHKLRTFRTLDAKGQKIYTQNGLDKMAMVLFERSITTFGMTDILIVIGGRGNLFLEEDF
ncbi:MAG: hypothetical protein ABI763_15075 [Bacteroidota bacterium]